MDIHTGNLKTTYVNWYIYVGPSPILALYLFSCNLEVVNYRPLTQATQLPIRILLIQFKHWTPL